MTAPVSLDQKPRVDKEKPIPFGFLRYPGSWFYLILVSVLGMLWIPSLFIVTKCGSFAEESQDMDITQLHPLNWIQSPTLQPLLLAGFSLFSIVAQMKCSEVFLCGQQQVGPIGYNCFLLLGWVNFLGWFLTGLLGWTLPAELLFTPFFQKMYLFSGFFAHMGLFSCMGYAAIYSRHLRRTEVEISFDDFFKFSNNKARFHMDMSAYKKSEVGSHEEDGEMDGSADGDDE